MTAPSQLRLLTLDANAINDATIYRLEKGWTLHFVLGPSLADKNVRIFLNHPTDPKLGPNRVAFRELKWENLSSHKSDVYDNFAEVRLVMAGSFNYYFTINKSDKMEDANGRGYFLVDPILRVGKMDDRISLDCIRCQSVLPKSLGTFDHWKDRLAVSKESGYNMIHFTPVQELGVSNSSYCLKDQLKLNHNFNTKEKKYTMKDLEELIVFMKDEWEVLSLTDLVFNHTANESPWILEHPECGYNMINSPHLKPAYLLDRILWHFSLEVGEGKWQTEGVPASLKNEDHLQHIRRLLSEQILPKHRIHEYFQVHIDDTTNRLKAAVLGGVRGDDRPDADIAIISDPSHRRLKSTVDIALAIKKYYSSQPSHISRDDRIVNACNSLRQRLVELNRAAESAIAGHLDCAVNNFIANGRWRFIDPNGPRIAKVSEKEPIMWNYFTLPDIKMTVEQEEVIMNSPKGAYCMAHNGWVMADDPLRNFAAPGSNIYLRRELIPWGDNVKLRYGDGPKDCPFLWEFMAKYVKETARIFHGVRLDNCHSTPINVAEYMLDEARKVRPDLYVIAELFTNSEYADNTFINRLGLNSLIREGLNAWDAHELGRLIHRFGGSPVGSFMQPPARPLMPSMAHAMLMDQTHDNESPIMKRSVYDLLPSSALIAMACCATGSNRGHDELVSHYIDVVKEKRFYKSWSADHAKASPSEVNIATGLIAAKKAINKLHHEVSKSGFEQIYVDQVNDEVVSVTRHNPTSHQSIILVAHTAFKEPTDFYNINQPPLIVPGVVDEIIFEARLLHNNKIPEYKADPNFINGLPDFEVVMKEHIKVADSTMVEPSASGSTDSSQKLNFVRFPPGSVIAFRVSLTPSMRASLLEVRQLLAQFGYRMRTFSARNLDEIKGGDIEVAIARLTLNDLNRIMFRCDNEERDDGKDVGAYVIPNYGPMIYCGLQGMVSILSKIRSSNDLGHPLCDNLRNGDWLMHYIAHRLTIHDSTKEIGNWLKMAFGHLSNAPRSLIPCYFDAIVTGVYYIAEEVSWAKMSEFIKTGSTFLRALAWGSVQMCSYVKTAKLPRLAAGLTPPLPPVVEENGQKVVACVTMSAGLPHFSSGLFRNWGRDTFIAFRGLLLIPGRYDEARLIILGYGGCLRHGLIPNLLGEGISARYNCRDAVWFWLQCIKDYCEMKPGGISILKDRVARLYPTDDSPLTTSVEQPLEDVMQEALQRHATGVSFRERNAGFNLDSQMKDQGFYNRIGVDWETGFVTGGNEFNCGTWMDKMGSSEKAGNKGVPATPRDGAAVELVGLCASVVNWLGLMFEKKKFSYDGVRRTIGENTVRVITYKQWAELIAANFENHFWITRTKSPNEVNSHLVNRRGIYKDTVGSNVSPWTDYQLRPNFPIAIAVAPEITNPERAWHALFMAEENLLGPLGMKTLDPSDWSYNGYYNNDEDSANFNTAKGFNYHQGPEWVWPVGFFLRAKLKIAFLLDSKHPGIFVETVNFVKHTLSAHREHVFSSDWRGLPELTNKDGAYCPPSCQAQAWSAGCILEVLYDMELLCGNIIL